MMSDPIPHGVNWRLELGPQPFFFAWLVGNPTKRKKTIKKGNEFWGKTRGWGYKLSAQSDTNPPGQPQARRDPGRRLEWTWPTNSTAPARGCLGQMISFPFTAKRVRVCFLGSPFFLVVKGETKRNTFVLGHPLCWLKGNHKENRCAILAHVGEHSLTGTLFTNPFPDGDSVY